MLTRAVHVIAQASHVVLTSVAAPAAVRRCLGGCCSCTAAASVAAATRLRARRPTVAVLQRQLDSRIRHIYRIRLPARLLRRASVFSLQLLFTGEIQFGTCPARHYCPRSNSVMGVIRYFIHFIVATLGASSWTNSIPTRLLPPHGLRTGRVDPWVGSGRSGHVGSSRVVCYSLYKVTKIGGSGLVGSGFCNFISLLEG